MKWAAECGHLKRAAVAVVDYRVMKLTFNR
jgi:hypothetical protein